MSTPSPDIPESDLWDLDTAFNAAQDELATNDLVYHATEKALGEIARRFYPGIANWEPEQLMRLADRISRAAHSYCIELANLDFASDEAKRQ
jgi:hypothetical protein